MDYGTPPESLYARFVFPPAEAATQFWRGMLDRDIALSCLMVWLGIARSAASMQRVKR